ncbi:beta family protein [Oryzobacter sp. R7]|uniref:beta family protein n=1 Tax=Oryzobacter faecalis TaxID=3388656 RepID=UPI00398D01FB
MLYVPILKNKAGEMRALEEASTMPHLELMQPLVEVTRADEVYNEDELQAFAEKATRSVGKAWADNRPRPVMIDTTYAEADPESDQQLGASVLSRVLNGLREARVPAIPVTHLSDSDALVNEAGQAAHRDGRGACIRVTAEDLDDAVTPLHVNVHALAKQMQLSAGDVDLVLDFGAIPAADALALYSRLARFVLPPLTDVADWRSFALVSGAFPANLADVSAFQFGQLPRLDRDLWMSVVGFNIGRRLDYGDYAVTHPALQMGTAFAAPPQLRYTSKTEWLVVKGRRTDRRGHAQFFDLCRQLLAQYPGVVANPYASWGDAYIHTAASPTSTKGPGNASIWRAIGTSQHIAQVTRQLAAGDAP